MKEALVNLAAKLEQISASLDRLEAWPPSAHAIGESLDPGEGIACQPAPADERPAARRWSASAGRGAPVRSATANDTVRLPSPAFVETMMRSRERRTSFVECDLLFDPAWWMLHDLFLAKLRGKRLSVTAVTIGSGAPDTTALRYLRLLEARGYVQRVPDETDKRRHFIEIAKPTFDGMAAYFAALEDETMAVLPRMAMRA